MPFDTVRFALLGLLCGLAAQTLSPFGGARVGAAVVHRQPKATQVNRFARHDIGKTADYDAGALHDNQAFFSFPWSRKGDALSKQVTEVRNSIFLLERFSDIVSLQTNHNQKRSIAISNVHGAKYVINHRRQASTPQWISVPRNGTQFNSTASTSSSPDGMAGTVAIVSRNPNPNNDRVLASLFLVKQQEGKYVFDASDKNATKLFLMAVPTASSSDMSASASDTYPVKLAIPLDDGPYCATYDEAPPKPEPLTAQKCTGDSVRTEQYASQIFMYNSSSGVLQPTSFVGQSVDAGDVGTSSASPLVPSAASPSAASSASMGAANVGLTVSSDSVSPTPSAGASSVSWSRRDDGGSFSVQNVTLVFVPQRMASNAAAVQEVSTSTFTQTVIVYSSVASSSASVINAADATPSLASVASSSSSAAMGGVTGLSVEIIGNLLSSAPAGVFSRVGRVAAGSGKPAPSRAASNSPSPSMDAAAVATSYSAGSSASPLPSLSAAAVDGVASLSPSESSAAPASSSAGTLFERNAAAVSKVTPVSTEPYLWRFKAEGRF